MTKWWQWWKRNEPTEEIIRAQEAIARAARDEEQVKGQWERIIHTQMKAEGTSQRLDQAFRENHFSEHMWRALKGQG